MDNSNYLSGQYFDRTSSTVSDNLVCDNQYYSGYTIVNNQQLAEQQQHQQVYQFNQNVQQRLNPQHQIQPQQQQQLTNHLDGNNYNYVYNQAVMPTTNYNNYQLVINGDANDNPHHQQHQQQYNSNHIATTTTGTGTTTTTTNSNVISTVKEENKVVKTKRKKKINRKKEPSNNKKSASAYAHFFRDKQARIKEENKSASFGEISKIVASEWEALSIDEKAVYKRKAEVAKNDQFKDIALSHAMAVAGAKFNNNNTNNQLDNNQTNQNNLQQQQQSTQPPIQSIQSTHHHSNNHNHNHHHHHHNNNNNNNNNMKPIIIMFKLIIPIMLESQMKCCIQMNPFININCFKQDS
ncbi:putative uncharacterized protein DDB_G0272516 [Panonychus citri]|uniref:putative uncharacterized protein DDB_G0272516 n=1 Tax=Panonychus citri TaxID=50023 RepID=UPI002307F8D0|nr:putative uncharacterized protein DDB_G0272516 [Panonychus citri]